MDRRQNETPQIAWAKYPIPRIRHHANPQVYMPASQQHVIAPWYPPTRENAEWGSWFGNGRPADVLDLGCGRGAFLLRHALSHPELNILGIEVRQVLPDYINEIAHGEGIANAHAEWYSLANGLDWIAPKSIQYAVYFFPDPWPKKRHHKRRAFTTEFLTMLHRVIMPGGRLWLATDRPDVDAHQREVIAESAHFTLGPDESDQTWPFPFCTDQQLFCDSRSIPYVRYSALRNPD